MKTKLLICVLIFLQFLFSQDYSLSKTKKSIELSVGFNYSELYTTDNVGGNGINIGLYRRQELKNNWLIKTGVNYSSNHSTIKNVSVLPMYLINWDEVNYLYWRKFDLNYTYLEINSFLEIPVYSYKNLKFSALIGCGFELYLKGNNKIENVKHELFDKNTDQYDYSTGDHDIPSDFVTNIENSGLTFQVGSSFIYNRIVLNIYYDLGINGIDYIDNMEFGEKFHSINTTLGFIIK